MGRPKGSKNSPRNDGDGEETQRNTEVDGDKLEAYIRRIEEANTAQQEISSDRQQVFKELKAAGYNRDTVRAIVAIRKLSAEERAAADALMEEYMAALGSFAGTPLGRAGARGLAQASV